ncbi:hypothetical protein CF392_11740 [Tamilnaduibacter salinus]|uniref:Heme NO-binding domain-containing protein n=1 Tax=Tamilnaduibacter salinus TaxID=1484056 RepID=A0A2A2I0Q1_9GAMM|nr:heme NO-binding domain-containing protein [Tamilnaduibacter salinus]PAV25299.1 hypothetical protein CF392_11740 [Tamilnaduibacter salinus]
MIGLIQRVLVQVIEDQGGEAARDAICEQAGLRERPDFRIDQDYDDNECLALIQATADHFQLSEDDLFRLYADYFIRITRQQFPMFYEMSGSAREFLERQPRIHSTLAASLRDESSRARVRDKFDAWHDGESIHVLYRSPNRLCGLYEALFYRLLEEFGERGHLSVKACQKRGDEACEFCLALES